MLMLLASGTSLGVAWGLLNLRDWVFLAAPSSGSENSVSWGTSPTSLMVGVPPTLSGVFFPLCCKGPVCGPCASLACFLQFHLARG